MDIISWNKLIQLDSKERVIQILIDKLGLNQGDGQWLDLELKGDLGADDLDEVEIVMELEREFNVAISNDAFEQVETVKDLILLADPEFEITDGTANIAYKATIDTSVEQNDASIMEHEPFEILKNVRILSEVRRFQLGQDCLRHNGVGLWLGHEGDILEEIYDNPNVFINITEYQKHPAFLDTGTLIFLKDLNAKLAGPIMTKLKEPKKSFLDLSPSKRFKAKENIVAFESNQRTRDFVISKKLGIKSLTQIESISVLDSPTLEDKRKKTGQAFNRKMKQLAKMNEDLTIMRMILGIENED